MWPNFEDICAGFRYRLVKFEAEARTFSDELKKAERPMWDKGEVIAQSIIAMRHLEDARMRYGKVIQYLWDWVSKFDK